MDAEKFINAARVRLPLWNQQNKGYRDRDKVKKLWQEVDAEVNVSKEAAKKRWKSLRDVFRNELKKLAKPKSGDETPLNFSSKWTYFKILWFLKDQMTPRQLTGNLPTDDNASQLNEDVSNNHLFPDDIDDGTSVTPD
ncbi:transcription factor Adf-1-like [Anthonomus grandis grandis]|uniref:transcription factor Adf-1-like n=1 Tax=Anthonomus grandis grandis TaxID=2921223 RepID=UPI0021661933|nr:transcription factor Adf-1-like [Anthonomus grandis grandis]